MSEALSNPDYVEPDYNSISSGEFRLTKIDDPRPDRQDYLNLLLKKIPPEEFQAQNKS